MLRNKVLFLILGLVLINSGQGAILYNYYPNNETVWVYNNVSGNNYFSIQRIALEKSNTIYNETLNITSYVNYTLVCSDIKFEYKKFLGNHNITSINYYLVNGSEQPFNPCGKNLIKNNSYIVKASAYKITELDFAILLKLNVAGLVIPELSWWNSSILYKVNNNIPNGTRPRTIELNLSTSIGTNNNSWIYSPHFTFNQLNSSHWNTNIYFIGDNTTVIPFYFIEDSKANITAKIRVRLLNNGSIQAYFGGENYTINNSHACELSNEFCDRFPGTEVNLSKWTNSGGTVSNGLLSYTGGNMYSINSFSPDAILTMFGRFAAPINPEFMMFGLSNTGGSTRIVGYVDYSPAEQIYSNTSLVGNVNWSANNTEVKRTFKWYKSIGKVEYEKNDTTIGSYSDNANIPYSPLQVSIYQPGDQYISEISMYTVYLNESGWTAWGLTEQMKTLNITSWSNNKTNDQTLNFSAIKNSVIKFNASTDISIDAHTWKMNNSDQSVNFNNFTYGFPNFGLTWINYTAYNSTYSNYDYKNWSVDVTLSISTIRTVFYSYTLG